MFNVANFDKICIFLPNLKFQKFQLDFLVDLKNVTKRVFSCKDRRRYSRKRATFCRNSADRPSWRVQAPVYACRARLRLAEAPPGVSGRAVVPPRARGAGIQSIFVVKARGAYMELVLDKKTMHLIAIFVLFQRDIISGTNGVCIKRLQLITSICCKRATR